MKRHLLFAWVVLVAGTAASAAPASNQIHFDRWFVMTMAGNPVGYVHELVSEHDDQLISFNRTHMQIQRGNFPLTIDQQTRFIQTSVGKPIKAISITRMGSDATTRTMTFTKQGITLTIQRGEQQQTRTLPAFKPGWLTPVEEQLYLAKQIAAGVKQFSYRVVDPTMGSKPVTRTMTRMGRQNVHAFGKVVSAIAWKVTASSMPSVTMKSYTDDLGRDVRATTDLMPGLSMTISWADKQLALSRISPPRIMAKLLIHPDKAIANPRTLRLAIFQLHIVGKSADHVHLPQTGYQRVVWGDVHDARVVIDLNHADSPGTDLPAADDSSPSTMIDGKDPKIIALMHQALGDDAAKMTDMQKALRLRKFVASYITNTNLAVGMASASEVARTREGDCTEHAVLLAALLRTAGIPSRTATGLLYVHQFLGQDNVFGYHMWTQAWLNGPIGASGGEAASRSNSGDSESDSGAGGGRWVDLDPTLPADGPAFDATHITLGVSSMSDKDRHNDLLAMLPIFGRLEIKVVRGGGS